MPAGFLKLGGGGLDGGGGGSSGGGGDFGVGSVGILPIGADSSSEDIYVTKSLLFRHI